MTPFDRFKEFYGNEWPSLMADYLMNHHVYCGPELIALAKQEEDTWWIEYLAGDVREAFKHLPFWLPHISFSVKGRFKCYSTARLVNRFLSDDTVKDGFDNEMFRWWRWNAKGETVTASRTYDRC